MRESGFRRAIAGVSLVVAAVLATAGLVCSDAIAANPRGPVVQIARNGKGLLPIFAAVDAAPNGRPGIDQLAVEDLRMVLKRMTGGEFEIRSGPLPGNRGAGIYVGQAAAFESFPGIGKAPAGEGFALRTTRAGQVLVIGHSRRGVSHGVYTLLEHLGCRWYFPHPAWTVIPRQANVSVSINQAQEPDFSIQRRIWVGHGLHSPTIRRDFDTWMRRNRMGSSVQLVTSHSWPGIDPGRDFDTHPEWFGLVKGKRKPDKPCYANPQVISKGIARALAYFRARPSAGMISVSPADGVGFCECDQCRKLAKVVKIYPAHGPGAMFGTTADGKEVSLASETVFHYANAVADAVADKFPGKYVGILAYSSYAHPPSFGLRPNVYVELTRGYRRTPLTFQEQLTQFARKAKGLGIYEYYDVEQWSWDLPGAARAANLEDLAASIGHFHRNNIQSVIGETSNNWVPNGIGYYVISRLLWDVRTDLRAVEDEFYRKAFGPAAEPLKRFYRRWESGQVLNARTLALAHRDLAEAVEATKDAPPCRARVDHVRMYLHFLKAHIKPLDAKKLARGSNPGPARKRIADLGRYVSRLMDTGVIHSYAFNRYLKQAGDAFGCDTKDWQKPGRIPTPNEIDATFRADLKDFDLAGLRDVPPTLFSRKLAALKGVRAPAAAAPSIRGGWTQWLYVQADAGQTVRISFSAALPDKVFFVPRAAFESGSQELAKRKALPESTEGKMLVLKPSQAGYYQIGIAKNRPLTISHRAVMIGGKGTNFSRATLYFFVPRRTRRFLLIAHARGGPSLVVRNAEGKIILQARRSAQTDFVIDVPPGDDNSIWSFEGPDDAIGYGTARLIGIPNTFSLLPDQLLVPQETLR